MLVSAYMKDIPEYYKSGYIAKEHEDYINKLWEDSGYFNPDIQARDGYVNEALEPFSMVLPPPNVTGQLHTGHASMLTIQDIMTRYARMQGRKTLWLPGTDHAAIATESTVSKLLKKEGINKRNLGREEFIKKVNEFALSSHNSIVKQVKAMGASLDWSREAYTLDDTRKKAVTEAFLRLYKMGLIYRGHRIVNWDVKDQTVISDDEIVRKEETTKFYYFKYGPFTIGTARPETKFSDKYIVVHPDDNRYAEFTHGQKIELEWINGPITATVIKDIVADPEKGSGAMTITPWHSQIDFEIAEKYNLEKEQIIDKFGKLLPVAGEFSGIKINEAREKIVEKLDKKGLLIRIEDDYIHQLATAERSGGIIEPQIMKQWFIDTDRKFPMPSNDIDGLTEGEMVTLKQIMRHVTESNLIEFVPEKFARVYTDWINNLRPWCISRQIWFGHRIPAFFKEGNEDKGIFVGETPPDDSWKQDPDTLDTWFSSGLWTFSTLGWPENTKDFMEFHPTTVLETGYDIIFFWVARMILMTSVLIGQIPFKYAYFHGLVRDKIGQKISKSLGNNVDPLTVIDDYGADAFRMSLIIGTLPGMDTRISEDKFRAYKKFANKLWNISRFVIENCDDINLDNKINFDEKHLLYLTELKKVSESITLHLDKFRYHLAGEELYHYIWHNFADIVLEKCKIDISNENQPLATSAKHILYRILLQSVKLLHPFMPFITERIWQDLKKPSGETNLLLVSKWPESA